MSEGGHGLMRDKAKTVSIPVRAIHGRLEYLNGGGIPDIRDEAVCELIVDEYTLLDDPSRFQREEPVKLLDAGTTVAMAVRRDTIPQERIDRTYSLRLRAVDRHSKSRWVKVELKEDLHLRLRGSKNYELMECKCHIPALGAGAESLNQAYTLVSQVFEPHRRSHTGNIFRKCFTWSTGDKAWVPLDWLRWLIRLGHAKDLYAPVEFEVQEVRLRDGRFCVTARINNNLTESIVSLSFAWFGAYQFDELQGARQGVFVEIPGFGIDADVAAGTAVDVSFELPIRVDARPCRAEIIWRGFYWHKANEELCRPY